jgi:ABC-type multidrug transport system ATPase subunit
VEVKTPREKPWKRRKKGVNKYERREILKEQSGQANPKETLFIMGASGCGKTSLLNLISDRIAKRKHSKIEGEIKVNDTVELNYESFSKIGAYVMQDDHLFSFFTPREALTFACRLKLHYTTKTE